MSDELSDKRAVRNEQLIRNKNEQAKNSIKTYFRGTEKVTSKPLEFICECSDPDCGKHVKLSISKYEALHKRRDYFTIQKGHEEPAVEKVVSQEPDYAVVEKEALNP